ncbi:MAG TPA: alpha-amylase family glycosyl hydrolase [Verrucomicrobiae bacterium]|nr:alpha-amylase family glycosyl hydrolase [Verrucomicrobiae bacterium]
MKGKLPSPLVQLTLITLLAIPSARVVAEDFSTQEARQGPQWLQNGILYEVFPRDFSAEGNFNGVTARLDELKDLGVNILWLMPIHPLGQKMKKGTIGSPYAVRDYYAINPDYGTEADLKNLVSEAHKRDMKVILDIVANHTAWDNVMMKHPEFYKQDANGKIIPPVPEWTDVAGLNYENPQLRSEMIDMLKHWLDPQTFDLDGFRCDVASMVPTTFWEQARAELTKVKPDIMMLAEASKPELLVKAFDIDYAWPFHGTLNEVLLNGAPASEFQKSWEDSRRQFPRGSLHMRISDNHDEARAVARFSAKGALAASALMFTLDGVPLLYNGMEVGDATESGDPALFEKLPIFWHPKGRPALRDIYRELIRLRKENPAFRNDKVAWLRNSDPANLVALMRLDDKNEFVVVINFSNRPVTGWVEVMHDQQFQPVKISGMPESQPTGFPLFRLGGFEWRIYKRSVN